jgi:hypothetical protein
MTGRVIDLDAARAARAEGAGEAPVVRFAGRDWVLPAELPWAIAEAATSTSAETAIAAVKSLLGDQWTTFVAAGPTVDDMRVMLEHVAQLYTVDPGK